VITHTVCFSLVHEPGSPAESDFFAAARRVLPAIPGVSDFSVARQIGTQSDLRFQFSMRFADRATYDAYSAHPDHGAFVAQRWVPEVAAFTEFDFVPADELGTDAGSAPA
jgi:hypothetical protein